MLSNVASKILGKFAGFLHVVLSLIVLHKMGEIHISKYLLVQCVVYFPCCNIVV